jgi:hypothetical protein
MHGVSDRQEHDTGDKRDYKNDKECIKGPVLVRRGRDQRAQRRGGDAQEEQKIEEQGSWRTLGQQIELVFKTT